MWWYGMVLPYIIYSCGRYLADFNLVREGHITKFSSYAVEHLQCQILGLLLLSIDTECDLEYKICRSEVSSAFQQVCEISK